MLSNIFYPRYLLSPADSRKLTAIMVNTDLSFPHINSKIDENK